MTSPEIPKVFEKHVAQGRWNDAFTEIESILAGTPFPDTTVAVFSHLVDQITRVEKDRGEIARSDRSALAPEAQPYQDLIDRILFRMAGLTDSEVTSLEQRLESML